MNQYFFGNQICCHVTLQSTKRLWNVFSSKFLVQHFLWILSVAHNNDAASHLFGHERSHDTHNNLDPSSCLQKTDNLHFDRQDADRQPVQFRTDFHRHVFEHLHKANILECLAKIDSVFLCILIHHDNMGNHGNKTKRIRRSDGLFLHDGFVINGTKIPPPNHAILSIRREFHSPRFCCFDNARTIELHNRRIQILAIRVHPTDITIQATKRLGNIEFNLFFFWIRLGPHAKCIDDIVIGFVQIFRCARKFPTIVATQLFFCFCEFFHFGEALL
mmetsp:Transcript_31623/g.48411  ORF Transcript_31623/g.48411 Transcript_31623/m.48411 type:complete len:274 (+) Transcript_31623:222-1043(+)